MAIRIDEKDLGKFVIVGDRVLIKPKNPDSRTKSGLFLPPSVQEKEKLQNGYIVKIGPGYAIPSNNDDDEVWRKQRDEARYVPLQARVGDLAIFLQNAAHEIEFNNERYLIVPHSAILMLIRDETLFE